MLVVHPHFHPRRTGVTTHTEQMVRAQAALGETKAMGKFLKGIVPSISLKEVWRRASKEAVIWHAHRNNELLVGFLLKIFRSKVRLVLTRHGSNRPGFFSRILFRLADALVTLNDEVAAMVRYPSVVVFHGVDTSKYLPPKNRAEAFAKLNLPGKYALGVVGRIRPEKGQGDFVEALVPLLDEFPEWTPVLVGLSKGEDAPWALKLREKTRGRLLLVGEKSDVLPWYQGLSVVVQPSHREAFSMVPLEAMACGCVVVASRLPAIPKLIEDGKTGFVYTSGDIESLRDILRRVLSSHALAERMGQSARQSVERQWAVENEAQALWALYQSL